METKDQENTKDTVTPQKLSLKERIEHNLLVFFLTALVTGFIAGYSAYAKIVDTSGKVLVGKDTYILKTDLVGTILKTEAVREIDHFIEIGQSINNNEAETRVWLMRVLAFIHGLNLEKDSEWNGHPMSAIESDIRYVFLDPSLAYPVDKTRGQVLQCHIIPF
jgi:hypothetical protein